METLGNHHLEAYIGKNKRSQWYFFLTSYNKNKKRKLNFGEFQEIF